MKNDTNDCQIDHHTVSMQTIMDLYIKGLRFKGRKRRLFRYDWFVSLDGKQVMFELTTFPLKPGETE